MGKKDFGVLGRPAVRQHFFESVVVGMPAQEEFADISPGL
jgi:hypothetical protein